ncbi:hypothetical protein [Glycomyces paridis]|uniref:Uncharacterized protein n=1 Tax=Glycomyces paridis TaxID=2126555 RepID=A0A4S8PC82_9ACTN|nr:hypothetical protein [Glycomyces paridis]THV27927.1 hypothetical protein E9998_13125 [Glycomyces paridis]
MRTECLICREPLNGTTYLCGRDIGIAKGNLAFIAATAVDLEVTVQRLDRRGDRGPAHHAGGGDAVPLPYNAGAAEVRTEIHAAMVGLATWVANTRRDNGGHVLLARVAVKAGPDAEAAAAARYLAANLRWIAGHPNAGDVYTAITATARKLAHTCGHRPAMTDLGLCGTPGCDGQLRAPVGAREVRCRGCGAPWSVAAIRDMLLDWAADRLFTAAELAPILSRVHRRRIPKGTIGSWATRGHLEQRGRLPNGTALYRLADARDVAATMYPEKELAA